MTADRHRGRGALWLWLGGILALTFVVYIPSLDNGFTNWDDAFYVTENPLLAHPAAQAVLSIPVAGNYHPLTIWSLALNYRLSGLNPSSYHWLNLILHVANTALVFWFIWRLSAGRFWTSVVTSALFGIHPMHVESVAWIAERKDVLYTFFFLLGLIAYLRYLDRRQLPWLAAALVSFVLSAASKPAAVIFPLVLLAIDLFRGRPIRAGILVEKIPFFAVAMVVGLLTLHVQRASGAITAYWSPFQKALFAAYGMVMYIVKLFVPAGLSAIYPYPSLAKNSIGPQYYVALAAAVILVPGLIFLFRRSRAVLFGLAFYLLGIILVLQFFTIGGAVMADRYTYLAYVGLLFALAWWLDERPDRLPKAFPVKAVIAGVLLVLTPVSAYLTWKRCEVWQNSETLWNDTITKFPHRIADAYNNRGFYYYNDVKRYDAALADFEEALALNSRTAKIWVNHGNTLAAMGRNDSALVSFNRAIALDPKDPDAWNNRGAVKIQMENWAGAISDCSRALDLNQNHRDAYSNRSLAYIRMGENAKSIADSRRAVDLAPGRADAYLQFGTIGVAFTRLQRYREAIGALDEAIRRAPPSERLVSAYYLYRSFAWSKIGDVGRALGDAREAQRRGVQVDAAYLKKLGG